MNPRNDSFASAQSTQWNAELYDSKHAFVYQYGADLLDLLVPQAGEKILDLGCGTGHLTQAIASAGAEVVGTDNSASMIRQAQQHYPNLVFELGDATQLRYFKEFDAVFSNATLHWVTEPEKAIASINRALRRGGRFVAEFGGKGNVEAIVTAVLDTFKAAGYTNAPHLNPWYFPSIGEYTPLLEQRGFKVTFAQLFDRLTPLEDSDQGMRNWITMFAHSFLEAIPAEQRSELLAEVESRLRPSLYREGRWYADYRRIRVVAVKVA